MGIHFPVAKLLDHHADLESLLTHPNPFALVTAAHLLTQQTKRDPQQRVAAKWRLAKLLYQRDWDKQRIIDLFSVLDWMMQVPPELQRQLWQDIDQLERNQQMPYVTSVERIGIEKGLQQGLQQGRLEGKLEGKLEGEVTLLLRQLTKRFGPLDESIRSRLENATLEQLELWAERVLDAKTLDDVIGAH
jgi:predicted transposase YdaD